MLLRIRSPVWPASEVLPAPGGIGTPSNSDGSCNNRLLPTFLFSFFFPRSLPRVRQAKRSHYLGMAKDGQVDASRFHVGIEAADHGDGRHGSQPECSGQQSSQVGESTGSHVDRVCSMRSMQLARRTESKAPPKQHAPRSGWSSAASFVSAIPRTYVKQRARVGRAAY